MEKFSESFMVKISIEMKDRIRIEADQEDRTLSNMVRRLIAEALEARAIKETD